MAKMETNARAQVLADSRRQGVFKVLWRRRTVAVLVFGLIFALSVLALVVLPTRYLAVGSVIVAEQEPSAENTSAAWAEKIGDPADLESQLLVIRSPRVLRLAMGTPGSLDAVSRECERSRMNPILRWLYPKSASTCEKLKPGSEALIDYVQAGYSVSAVGRSRVINISWQSGQPDIARTLANALINAFLEDQRSNVSSGRKVAADWLWQELRQLDLEIQDEDARIQAFRREKGLMRGANAPITSEQLTAISQQLSAAEVARADAAARLREIEADRQGGTINAPAVLASRAVADLKQQLSVITAQVANATAMFGPRHPMLHGLQQELDSLQLKLAKEVDSVAASAKKADAEADALVTSLRQQVQAAKAEVASATTDETSIENMVRSVETKRQQYADLYKRASELETQQRVLLGSTRLVSLAELPSKPFFPKPLPFLAAGLVLALLGSVGTAIVRERSDQTVRSASALVMETGVAAVTSLPRLRRPGSGLLRWLPFAEASELPLGTALLVGDADPALQEVLRKLYSELVASGAGRNLRRILVTSVGPKEGKTFSTLALARFVAAAGRRVLVIDCDLRGPTFETALGLQRRAGLTDILRGTVQARQAVMKTADPNLDVIVAGAPTVESTELLLSRHMSELLLWAQSYDLVLLDSPPVNALTDACVIAGRVDGVLCCCRWGHSTVADAMAATARIRAVGGPAVRMLVTMAQDGGDYCHYEDSPLERDAYLRAS
jgi:capsular exopolysaccharide synthesis family protein